MSDLPYTGGPKLFGKDYNFFKILTVTAGSFPTQPDVIITSPNPMNLIMMCTSSTGNVSYSFNGNTTHGQMNATAPLNYFVFDYRNVDKIWFSGTGTIHVHAYSH
jgi:hypothetical protein